VDTILPVLVLLDTGAEERRPDPDWWILLLPARPFREIGKHRETENEKAGDGALITGTEAM
jgi:hypothetical protein